MSLPDKTKILGLDRGAMADKPLVTVIIATHNRAALLQEALGSVYEQEGRGEQFDLEVIVVDDASSDETPEVVRRKPWVRYIRFDTNRGHAAARNAGIKAGRGKYVGFLDDDDQWLPYKLKVQVPVLEARPDVGCVYGQSIVIDNGLHSLRPNADAAPSGNVFRALLMKEFLSVNTPLIRRDGFQKAGYFDETLPRIPHYDLFLRLAYHFPFVFVPGAVAVGHVNNQGLFFTHLAGDKGYIQTISRITEKGLALIQDAEDFAQVKQAVLGSVVVRIFNWLGKIDNADGMRNYLFTALKTYPWMITNKSAQPHVARAAGQVALAMARSSDSPIATVRDFFAEFKSVARRSGLRARFQTHRLLAEGWANVAGLLRTRSPRNSRAARYAAVLAFVHDPSIAARRFGLKRLTGAAVSPRRWGRILSSVKHLNNGSPRMPRAATAGPSKTMRQEWAIGIYGGNSVFDLRPHEGAANPILTRDSVSDVEADFVADPFMTKKDASWHMFFEVWNRSSGKGDIGLASSEDGLNWRYREIVLSEPFHLSYPYVFEWMDDYYMIPETSQTGCIRLYRAKQFPTQWSFVGTLLSGRYFSDASIFQYNGKWWLLTETSPQRSHDTLRLYYADHLGGPWLEHPRSPVIEGDPHTARPAGRVLVLNGKVIRFAQDCYPRYGIQVRAFEIAELTPIAYSEREVHSTAVLRSSGTGWNEHGMHHIDPHRLEDSRWIACVDGWSRRPHPLGHRRFKTMSQPNWLSSSPLAEGAER